MPTLQPRPCLATPVDHALALHPAGAGRVSIARRLHGGWREQSVPVADLAYAARQLAGETDVYLTQNRFFGRRRLVSRLAELDALFVDLDYYKTEHADAHPPHVLTLALEALQDERLPPPSFAVASGRGLALVWLHHAVPRAALPRWRACQHVLWHTLRHLGADRLASDAARVLRLVGTRNSRSSTLVEGLMAPREPWDFDQLADEILPLQRAELGRGPMVEQARSAHRHRDTPRPPPSRIVEVVLPLPTKPEFKQLGGSDSDQFNQMLANQTLGALWVAHSDADSATGNSWPPALP